MAENEQTSERWSFWIVKKKGVLYDRRVKCINIHNRRRLGNKDGLETSFRVHKKENSCRLSYLGGHVLFPVDVIVN